MGSRSSDKADGLFHKDRHVHGGLPEKYLDDDVLAHEAEDERVEVGLDPFNPDDVPPATDTPPLNTDIRDTEHYREERAEIRREEEARGRRGRRGRAADRGRARAVPADPLRRIARWRRRRLDAAAGTFEVPSGK